MPLAHFRFHGALCTLPGVPADGVAYTFVVPPSVKDAMEALGVPHPEVAALVVNGRSVDFSYGLRPDDRIDVFPHGHPLSMAIVSLRPVPPLRFILDVHLGALARQLRLLGLDCLYRNDYTDRQIADLAADEGRIVLTRDVGLLKHKKITWGHWLRAQLPDAQAREVIRRFHLEAHFQPFTRCLVCNGPLLHVDEEEVLSQLPAETARCFQEFYRCSGCGKIYWKGSHYDRMRQWIERIKRELE